MKEKELHGKLSLSRRRFLKVCASAAAALGLGSEAVPKIAEAVTSPKRPPVIWLHFMECTGCSESLLRADSPDLATLILDLVSLDYHETLMAAAGHQAEKSLMDSVEANAGKFVLVVEGAVCTGDGGVYCKVAGKTNLETLEEIAPKAGAIIAVGTCATFGGIQAAAPNPTGAVGVRDVIKNKPVVNIAGCPPSPNNFFSTVLYYLTYGRLPALDELGRPKFAYGRKIHDHCERRPHFDEGRFVESFGDEGHKAGYCLYKVGCKGPATFANCPVQRFCDVNWPVGAGHGCIGCTEPGFWDRMSPFYEHLPDVRIPAGDGIYVEAEKIGKWAVAGAAAALAGHAALGVGKKVLDSRKCSSDSGKED